MESWRALVVRKRELEELLEAPDEIEPVKAEALSQLESLENLDRSLAPRTRDTAEQTSDAVRKAISRFYRAIKRPLNPAAPAHPVLEAFAVHLHDYLLVPSGRAVGSGGLRPKGTAGRWFYCPPPEVIWRLA